MMHGWRKPIPARKKMMDFDLSREMCYDTQINCAIFEVALCSAVKRGNLMASKTTKKKQKTLRQLWYTVFPRKADERFYYDYNLLAV